MCQVTGPINGLRVMGLVIQRVYFKKVDQVNPVICICEIQIQSHFIFSIHMLSFDFECDPAEGSQNADAYCLFIFPTLLGSEY